MNENENIENIMSVKKQGKYTNWKKIPVNFPVKIQMHELIAYLGSSNMLHAFFMCTL